MNLKNFGMIEGRIVGNIYAHENKNGYTEVGFRLKIKDGITDKNRKLIQFKGFIPSSRDFESTIYAHLGHYSPVKIQYSIRSYGNLQEPELITNYFHIESIDLKGNGRKDLITERTISDKLINRIRKEIEPVNGHIKHDGVWLTVIIPDNDGPDWAVHLSEPDSNGYRALNSGTVEFAPHSGNGVDNDDEVVLDEVRRFVRNALM